MVSIVIPYIDEHGYLAEALQSARDQVGVDVEIILVCNAKRVDAGYHPFPEDQDRIVFIHEPRKGSAYARNAGLQAAKGEWVQFLDVDDLLLREKILHQSSGSDADVIVSPHMYVYTDGHREPSKWLPDDIWFGLLNSGLGSTSSMLWKRLPLLTIGGWNPDWTSHQEYELLFRCLSNRKHMATNDHCETLVRQREAGSITQTTSHSRILEGIRLREMIWTFLVREKLDTPDRFDAFRQYVFRQLRGLYRQDRVTAITIYNKYFLSRPFVPADIRVPGYRILYRLIGFKRTEQIIQWFISFRR